MSAINLNLNGKHAEILNEYPIVFSNEDTIEIIINNYQKEHKYKLVIDYLTFDFTYDKLELDLRYLDHISKAYITDNGKIYDLNPDKFTSKRVINIGSGDKLNDLLLVLYKQNVILEEKYNEIIEKLNAGDLML